jgi:hypothetical protein
MAAWKIVCFASLGLAVSVTVTGCDRGPAINGEFNVSYVWIDGKLQNAVIALEKPKGSISEATRKAVVETVRPYIADTMQASGLSRASGRIRASIYGTPPYFVQIRASAITEPDFSELRAAVEREDIERIRHLVTSFHNLNQRELPSRQTALAIAAAGGHVKSLQTLLLLGADPNIADGIGVTPLMNAVLAGSEEAVATLIRAGAILTAINKAGDSATSLAKQFGREKMLPLLAAKQQPN